jgi:hypothetical protein
MNNSPPVPTRDIITPIEKSSAPDTRPLWLPYFANDHTLLAINTPKARVAADMGIISQMSTGRTSRGANTTRNIKASEHTMAAIIASEVTVPAAIINTIIAHMPEKSYCTGNIPYLV